MFISQIPKTRLEQLENVPLLAYVSQHQAVFASLLSVLRIAFCHSRRLSLKLHSAICCKLPPQNNILSQIETTFFFLLFFWLFAREKTYIVKVISHFLGSMFDWLHIQHNISQHQI